MRYFDCIVLGLGGVGSSALYHLSQKKLRILALEQFSLGHDRGSSHGQARMIRQAYYKNPAYVPLALRSYELWKELENLSKKELLVESGVLHVGPPEGSVIPGTLEAAKNFDLEVEIIQKQKFTERFPDMTLPEGHIAALEKKAGYLKVEDCVQTYLNHVRKDQVEIQTGVQVHSWRADRRGVVVKTEKESFSAHTLVLCPGPWAAQVFPDYAKMLYVLKKSMFWFEAKKGASQTPSYLYEEGDKIFYGFPSLDGGKSVRVSEHSGGQKIENVMEASQEINEDELKNIQDFSRKNLKFVNTDKVLEHKNCFYTMTSDEDFILGQHPRFSQVVMCCGTSGHGFKFASAMGEIISYLALDLQPSFSIDFLSPRRPSLFSKS